MRKLSNWLDSFIELGQRGESPNNILFWSGVSAISGALQRKVWFDQEIYVWFPNMFIVVVGPPGVVTKTTVADLSMDLLRKVEEVHFGPNVVTWQALVNAFKAVPAVVEYTPGDHSETYSLTIVAGEFGNFMAPDDRQMMDMLVTLWDCKGVKKLNVGTGEAAVENPCLNVLACTTPAWLSGNVPHYMIEGGLVSRIIWVYGDHKRQLVAYPGLNKEVPSEHIKTLRRYLIDDLGAIARLQGEFSITPEAIEWGTDWYRRHYEQVLSGTRDSRLGGWDSRKQTHIHKLAMALSVARGDSLVIEREDLVRAEAEVSGLEKYLLTKVFHRIGQSDTSSNSDRLMDYIACHPQGVPADELQREMHNYFPRQRDFDDIMKSLIGGKMLKKKVVGGQLIYYKEEAK